VRWGTDKSGREVIAARQIILRAFTKKKEIETFDKDR